MQNQSRESSGHARFCPQLQRKSLMAHTLKTFGIIGAVLSLVFLTACGAETPTSTPTLDLNPFRTEVAATVLAQVSQTLSALPTSTPTSTSTPTITLTLTPTVLSSPTPSPTGTLTIAIPATPLPDRAQWVSQSVTDGTIFTPGETFTMTWTIRNVGASTWTAAYLLRFYSGSALGAPNEVLLGRVVAPDETVDISVSMTAPTTPGDYRSDWVLSNESRLNFQQPVFLKITVAAPFVATPTRTPTVTPTP
jgi:hypothetical protein